MFHNSYALQPVRNDIWALEFCSLEFLAYKGAPDLYWIRDYQLPVVSYTRIRFNSIGNQVFLWFWRSQSHRNWDETPICIVENQNDIKGLIIYQDLFIWWLTQKKAAFHSWEWNVAAVRALARIFQNYWLHVLIERKLHLKTSEFAQKVHLVVEIEHLKVEKVEIFPKSFEILK